MDMINPEYLDLKTFSNRFRESGPFPHLVLDNFLKPEVFREQIARSQDLDKSHDGKSFTSKFETNKWISKNSDLALPVASLVESLNSQSWVENMARLTGLPELVSTSCGNTQLANYHEMAPKGYLSPHVDHSSDPDQGLPHVLNIIVYLSPNWEQEHGGSTLFYDAKGRNIEARVEYRPNRAVIFLHTPFSFHCVDHIDQSAPTRKSIYVDYYSKSLDPYKSFSLPFPSIWFEHGTTFVLDSFSDYLKLENSPYAKTYLKYQFNRFKRMAYKESYQSRLSTADSKSN